MVKSMSPWLGDLSVQSSLLKLLSSAPESVLNIETSASSISQRSQTPVIHFATCSFVHFCGSKKQMYNSHEILACWSFLIHYCALFCCLVSFRATLKPKIASHKWIPLLFCSFPLLGWELSFFSIPTEIKKILLRKTTPHPNFSLSNATANRETKVSMKEAMFATYLRITRNGREYYNLLPTPVL